MRLPGVSGAGMNYTINGKPVFLEITGSSAPGEAVCLLEQDDNLAEGCEWQEQGFVVAQMLEQVTSEKLQDGVRELLREALWSAGSQVDDAFSLGGYHHYCRDQRTHLKVIDFLRNKAAIENLPIDYRILDEKISDQCGKRVSCNVNNQIASGYFFIRLVRPLPCQDNNPPHKDAWLDRLRHGLNLYLPLAGSNEDSSLSLVPGSHLWEESDIPRSEKGAKVNGVEYSVPSVVMDDHVVEMIRPVVNQGEAMLFSPYLIHGGAVNFNSEKTRVSLEMRFWRCF